MAYIPPAFCNVEEKTVRASDLPPLYPATSKEGASIKDLCGVSLLYQYVDKDAPEDERKFDGLSVEYEDGARFYLDKQGCSCMKHAAEFFGRDAFRALRDTIDKRGHENLAGVYRVV